MSRLLLVGSLVICMSLTVLAAEEKDKPAQPPKRAWWENPLPQPDKPITPPQGVMPPTHGPMPAPPPGVAPVLPPQHGVDPYSLPQRNPAPAPTPPVVQRREIYRVKHLPAADLAEAINEVLRSQRAAATSPYGPTPPDVIVVPEVISNVLVVHGEELAVNLAVQLATQLDIQPKMVQIRTLLVEIHASDDTEDIGGLLKRLSDPEADEDFDEIAAAIAELPGLRLLGGPQLTVLDNQAGFLQLGHRVPRITGAVINSGGRMNTIEMEDVGLILGVTARINDDGLVTMEVDLEKSQLGPADEGTPISVPVEGEPIRASQVETLVCQTTIAVRDGQTTVLGGLTSRESEMVILISPRIIEP